MCCLTGLSRFSVQHTHEGCRLESRRRTHTQCIQSWQTHSISTMRKLEQICINCNQILQYLDGAAVLQCKPRTLHPAICPLAALRPNIVLGRAQESQDLETPIATCCSKVAAHQNAIAELAANQQDASSVKLRDLDRSSCAVLQAQNQEEVSPSDATQGWFSFGNFDKFTCSYLALSLELLVLLIFYLFVNDGTPRRLVAMRQSHLCGPQLVALCFLFLGIRFLLSLCPISQGVLVFLVCRRRTHATQRCADLQPYVQRADVVLDTAEG